MHPEKFNSIVEQYCEWRKKDGITTRSEKYDSYHETSMKWCRRPVAESCDVCGLMVVDKKTEIFLDKTDDLWYEKCLNCKKKLPYPAKINK
jgi:hypothetical protein